VKINLSHFEAALLFALFASVVLGIVTKKSDRERILYGAKCFGYFILALFAIGWAMKLGHG
jgi:putative Mn2+ efflux pump MntP